MVKYNLLGYVDYSREVLYTVKLVQVTCRCHLLFYALVLYRRFWEVLLEENLQDYVYLRSNIMTSLHI